MYWCSAPSTNDHYSFKEEFEPVVAQMAEISMCEAHEEAIKLGAEEGIDYVTVDGGYTQPRNAKGCTMAAHVNDSCRTRPQNVKYFNLNVSGR